MMANKEMNNKLKENEEDTKLMKTMVIKHKAATKQLSRELTDLVGRNVNTDNPKDLIDVIKELQHKLSDAHQETREAVKVQRRLKMEIAKLENDLGDHKLAFRKLKKGIAETLGTHKDDDDPEALN